MVDRYRDDPRFRDPRHGEFEKVGFDLGNRLFPEELFWSSNCAVPAADFWAEKDFTTWSPQQIDKMLTDSPWAKKATIVVGSLREGGDLGGFQSGGAGVGGGGGAGRDSDAGGSEFTGVRRINVTVAWISALPVRQAIARLRAGVDAPVLPDDKRLPEDEAFYVVAVAGLPTRMAQAASLNEVVDKSVIGGIRVEIGDDVIDGTVASRLDEARRRLAG